MTAARDELAEALRMEFGSFLAHDPHNPDKFWGQAAEGLIRRGFGDVAQAKAEALEEAHRTGYEDAICYIYASADAEPEVLAEFMEFYEPPAEYRTPSANGGGE